MMLQDKMTAYSSKSSKGGPLFPLRSILVFLIALFGFYVCYFSYNQIALGNEEEEMTNGEEQIKIHCTRPSIPHEQMPYVHFPKPMSYDRGECSCTPVRFFVIVSMQRSGSGWFETLLNSHPNVSSNGEIFSARERRGNIASISRTLDKLYNLDWLTSAAKNECTAAFGLKWMLNQGLMDHHNAIVNYLNKKGVKVIFLFRRNILRRLISVLANDYDRKAKQLNGTHKSHVHSQEETESPSSLRSAHAQPLSNSPSAAAASHHHHLLPQAAPFILGKRVRGDDDDGDGGGADVATTAALGPAPGFWALPARADFGQLWSFAAAPDMMVAAPAMAGEASAARVGNYLPMAQGNLNLLASFSGGPGAAGPPTGRAEEETAR